MRLASAGSMPTDAARSGVPARRTERRERTARATSGEALPATGSPSSHVPASTTSTGSSTECASGAPEKEREPPRARLTRSAPSRRAREPISSEAPASTRTPKVLLGRLSPTTPPLRANDPPESTCTTPSAETLETLPAMAPPLMLNEPFVHTMDSE